jgi:hypothetical protein
MTAETHGDGPIDLLELRAWHSALEHEWNEPIGARVSSLATSGDILVTSTDTWRVYRVEDIG